MNINGKSINAVRRIQTGWLVIFVSSRKPLLSIVNTMTLMNFKRDCINKTLPKFALQFMSHIFKTPPNEPFHFQIFAMLSLNSFGFVYFFHAWMAQGTSVYYIRIEFIVSGATCCDGCNQRQLCWVNSMFGLRKVEIWRLQRIFVEGNNGDESEIW